MPRRVLELVGVGEQGPAGVADQVGRGLGAGEQQQGGEAHGLLAGEHVVALGPTSVVSRSSRGVLLALVDLGAEVVDHAKIAITASSSMPPRLDRSSPWSRRRPRPGSRPTGGVGAEQFGDDPDRQRRRQLADDVEPVAGRRRRATRRRARRCGRATRRSCAG